MISRRTQPSNSLCRDANGTLIQPYTVYRGRREPSYHAPPEHSGIDAGLLTWVQQWRLLETIRHDEAFRDELRDALGVRR